MQKGFSKIFVVIVAVLLLGFAGGAVYFKFISGPRLEFLPYPQPPDFGREE